MEFHKLCDSGTYSPYKMGVFLHQKLEPNENGYLVVCSTYERGQMGKYMIDIESLNGKI
jgi:hypothetical protein